MIRSTHVGSLIRPASLLEFEAAIERGESYDEAAYAADAAHGEVADVVSRQAEAGIDVVNDGEFGKASWITYLYERISGVEPRALPGEESLPPSRDRQAFPGTYAQHDAEMFRAFAEARTPTPEPSARACAPARSSTTGPRSTATSPTSRPRWRASTSEGFLPVVAPASTYWLDNEHYGTEEEFVYALADALAVEYNAIVDAGLMLQVDDAVLMHEMDSILPRAARSRTTAHGRSCASTRSTTRSRASPPEKVRYHVCWGSWHGPHAYDPPLADVVDLVLQVNADAYTDRAGQPAPRARVARLGGRRSCPRARCSIPGVVTHHTNDRRAPRARRRAARAAGRASSGARTSWPAPTAASPRRAFMQRVHPEIQWAKLEALAEGARRASDRLGVAA